MEKLTTKEEEMMELLWAKGPMFVNEIRSSYKNRKTPHPNTVSTCAHKLENKGFISHRAYGGNFQYYPLVSKKEYRHAYISAVKNNYYEGSYFDAVRALIENGDIPIDELRKFIKTKE